MPRFVVSPDRLSSSDVPLDPSDIDIEGMVIDALSGCRRPAVTTLAAWPSWMASAKFLRKWPTLFDHRAAFVNVPRLGEQPTPVRITLPDSRVVSSEEEGLDRILSADLGRDVTLAKTAPQAPSLEEYWPDSPGVGVDQTSAPSCPEACRCRSAIAIRPFGPCPPSAPKARAPWTRQFAGVWPRTPRLSR